MFSTRHIQLTREEIRYYKEQQKAVNARPIKKIAEAKGRKKMKVRANYRLTPSVERFHSSNLYLKY